MAPWCRRRRLRRLAPQGTDDRPAKRISRKGVQKASGAKNAKRKRDGEHERSSLPTRCHFTADCGRTHVWDADSQRELRSDLGESVCLRAGRRRGGGLSRDGDGLLPMPAGGESRGYPALAAGACGSHGARGWPMGDPGYLCRRPSCQQRAGSFWTSKASAAL